jgi:SAM-dependent methyltransferase
MIEIDNPKIDIDRIKACIAEEMARYEAMDDPLDELEKQVMAGPAWTGEMEPLTPVDKAGLLHFQGEEFLLEAYRAILCREPDPEGSRVYLEKLLTGRLTRVDILGRLRYSAEGRRLKVKVPGLLPAFLAHSFFKVPVLGWGARVISGVLNFPALMRRIQRLETESAVRYRDFEKKADDLKKDLARMENQHQQSYLAVSDRIEDQKIMFLESQRQFAALLEETRTGRKETGLSPSLAAAEQDRLLDGFYVMFENRFRGTRAEIKARQSIYLPRVMEALERTGCRQVLDLGCGRGEWLELLKENQIPAAGLDMNRMMVGICIDNGLDAVRSDALTHLRGLAPESLGVITGFHIVEHLPFDTLIALLDESRRVLVPGGRVIFETPNPENIQVGACDFYTDPTHRNPIPPQTLCFLLEARGFVDPEILRLHPAKKTEITDPVLHHLFSIGKDYAVTGCRK